MGRGDTLMAVMGRSTTTFVLLLLLTAFAGRPAAYCLMQGTVEAAHESHAKPAKACHDEAPAPATSCMVDLGTDAFAPSVDKSPVPPVVAVTVAVVPQVWAIAAPRLAPSLTTVAAFESPPASITILRI